MLRYIGVYMHVHTCLLSEMICKFNLNHSTQAPEPLAIFDKGFGDAVVEFRGTRGIFWRSRRSAWVKVFVWNEGLSNKGNTLICENCELQRTTFLQTRTRRLHKRNNLGIQHGFCRHLISFSTFTTIWLFLCDWTRLACLLSK